MSWWSSSSMCSSTFGRAARPALDASRDRRRRRAVPGTPGSASSAPRRRSRSGARRRRARSGPASSAVAVVEDVELVRCASTRRGRDRRALAHAVAAEIERRREQHQPVDASRPLQRDLHGDERRRGSTRSATTGAAGSASIAAPTCSTIRVIVSVEKSGSLKSGVCERRCRARAACAAKNVGLRRPRRRGEAVKVEDVHHGQSMHLAARACSGTGSSRRRRSNSRRSAPRPSGCSWRRGSRSCRR